MASGRAVAIERPRPDEHVTIGEARRRIAEKAGTTAGLIRLVPSAQHGILPDDHAPLLDGRPLRDGAPAVVLGIDPEAERAAEEVLLEACRVYRLEDMVIRGELRLKRVGFSRLPHSVGQLAGLQSLLLHGNKLAGLPGSIGELTALRELWLQENQLTSLPGSIGQLAALEELNLSMNLLVSLPESIGQLAALRDLDVAWNQLAGLPQSIGQLTALKWLDFRRNQLTSLPSSLGQLAVLEQLDLSYNRLTCLPQSLGQLAALQQLNLTSNRLTRLPQSLGRLTALRRLALRQNWLAGLPRSLGRLPGLGKPDLDPVARVLLELQRCSHPLSPWVAGLLHPDSRPGGGGPQAEPGP